MFFHISTPAEIFPQQMKICLGTRDKKLWLRKYWESSLKISCQIREAFTACDCHLVAKSYHNFIFHLDFRSLLSHSFIGEQKMKWASLSTQPSSEINSKELYKKKEPGSLKIPAANVWHFSFVKHFHIFYFMKAG